MENQQALRRLDGREHTVHIDGRQRVSVSGVEDVDSFNENEVIFLTSMGMITVMGEDLHIARLDLEAGQLVVEGTILRRSIIPIMPKCGRKRAVFSASSFVDAHGGNAQSTLCCPVVRVSRGGRRMPVFHLGRAGASVALRTALAECRRGALLPVLCGSGGLGLLPPAEPASAWVLLARHAAWRTVVSARACTRCWRTSCAEFTNLPGNFDGKTAGLVDKQRANSYNKNVY